MIRIFDNMREHLVQQNETYFEHMLIALTCSFQLALAAACCFVHAFFPFLFTRTATKIASDILNKRGKRKVLHD